VHVLVIGHHAEDDAGLIGEALEEQGAELTTHLFPEDGALPPVDHFSHVVVLGAKWSVYDTETVGAWMDDELDWLRRADLVKVPVLGICFGAQSLTAALGGRVERAPMMEIGWVMVEPRKPEKIAAGPWFQSHGDRCVIPASAELLASNDVGVQAFAIGPHLGVQFHPEINAAQLGRWMENGMQEEIEAAGVDPGRLLAETSHHESGARLRAAGLVRVFLGGS
jgi:GMP synthase-like glutamine amidotransferase